MRIYTITHVCLLLPLKTLLLTLSLLYPLFAIGVVVFVCVCVFKKDERNPYPFLMWLKMLVLLVVLVLLLVLLVVMVIWFLFVHEAVRSLQRVIVLADCCCCWC